MKDGIRPERILESFIDTVLTMFLTVEPRLRDSGDFDHVGIMRTPVIGGNWKMYKDPARTTSFFESVRPLIERSDHCEIVICPSFLGVENAVAATRGTRIRIGPRNL